MSYLYPAPAIAGIASGQPGTVPTVAGKWTTAITPTGATLTTANMPNDLGYLFSCSFASTTYRCASRVDSGTSVIALIQSMQNNPAGGTILGNGVCLTRIGGTDNKIITCTIGKLNTSVSYLRVTRWTDKDTPIAELAAYYMGQINTLLWLSMQETGGNIVCRASTNGSTWASIYSAATATAWGSAGATTQAGIALNGYASAAGPNVQQMIVSRYQ